MSLGLRLIESRLLLGMLKVDSFPSIHNSVVDGIPENYFPYYKKYLYEIEFFRFKKGVSVDSRHCDILVTEKEKQLVIDFKFDEK
nr:MAG TPA: hypothetical protein [Microviridae sp.]